MRYCLTEEEYKKLQSRSKEQLDRWAEAMRLARNEILRKSSFVCVYDTIEKPGPATGRYCDRCPCSYLSRRGSEAEAWKTICPLKKVYSK